MTTGLWGFGKESVACQPRSSRHRPPACTRSVWAQGLRRTSLPKQEPAGAAGCSLGALSRHWWEDVGVQTRGCWLLPALRLENKIKTKSRNKYEGMNTLLGDKLFKEGGKKKPLRSEKWSSSFHSALWPLKTRGLFQLCVWLKGNFCTS